MTAHYPIIRPWVRLQYKRCVKLRQCSYFLGICVRHKSQFPDYNVLFFNLKWKVQYFQCQINIDLNCLELQRYCTVSVFCWNNFVSSPSLLFTGHILCKVCSLLLSPSTMNRIPFYDGFIAILIHNKVLAWWECELWIFWLSLATTKQRSLAAWLVNIWTQPFASSLVVEKPFLVRYSLIAKCCFSTVGPANITANRLPAKFVAVHKWSWWSRF